MKIKLKERESALKKQQESFDKAIYIASQIETEDVFNKCIILMEKLGFEKQAKKAKEFA